MTIETEVDTNVVTYRYLSFLLSTRDPGQLQRRFSLSICCHEDHYRGNRLGVFGSRSLRGKYVRLDLQNLSFLIGGL